jgi:hypothetical protein
MEETSRMENRADRHETASENLTDRLAKLDQHNAELTAKLKGYEEKFVCSSRSVL